MGEKKFVCELCGKKTDNLFADTYYNEMLCEDCYSDYDPNIRGAEERHEVAWYRKILIFQ
jgi:hypothetical protein